MNTAAEFVLGLDVGGTSTRALLAGLDGTRVRVSRRGGGNPNAHPPEIAVREVGAAMRSALGSLDPGLVRYVVLGLAGASKMTDPRVRELFDESWRSLGLRCPVDVIDDCEVAFASATAEPTGSVVIAGTGSVLGAVDQGRLVRTAGGHGWLLGDEGSAFWLGREAVRLTLRELDADSPGGALSHAVLAALVVEVPGGLPPDRRDRITLKQRLLTAVNGRPPIDLAALAPLVDTSVGEGHAPAAEIARAGALALATGLALIRPPSDTTPLVMGGSVLGEGTSVGAVVRAELARRWGGTPLAAGDAAAGAAWLALNRLAGRRQARITHRRLLGHDQDPVLSP
ncbi:N-acetylglucosamine kinase [Actinoalloteichus caeruleus]|uniref:BadF-type ATPase n=1 Tax=Actinoalloteichus caeruleus DSM 43889 TaxID=1120930 RepID=A0ABT1JJY9_ACTCY|nr:BadF/BadG/BcrA/BcrD ATPase family protein [Actinoalloteichus caeruleus]MCP2332614.1 BadF-type ATPase [Actinoalloteichus caeruleus DSM 43889]